MYYKLNLCFLILFFTNANSQSKLFEIKTNKLLIEHKFIENGNIYLYFADVPKGFKSASVGNNIIMLSENLDKKVEYDFSDIEACLLGLVTPSGKINGFYEYSFDRFKSANYFYLNTTNGVQNKKRVTNVKGLSNYGGLKDVMRTVSTDEYQLFIGKKENRKNRDIKIGEDYNDIFMFRKDLNSLDTKLFTIDFPTESFQDKSVFYKYQFQTNDKIFYTLNKLENKERKNICRLVSFDFNGKLIDNIPFTLEFADQDLTFSISHPTPETTYESHDNEGRTIHPTTEASTIDVKLDTDGKSFYVFGDYFSNSETKKGYFIYKYDLTGKELWKIVNDDYSKKNISKHSYFTLSFDLFIKNNEKLGFWHEKYNTDERTLLEIDKQNGVILQTKTAKQNGYEDLYPSPQNASGLINSKMYFENKKSVKIAIDENTMYGINYNSEMENYILNAKKGSRFETYLSDKGIFVFEQNNKEKYFKVLKFEWK